MESSTEQGTAAFGVLAKLGSPDYTRFSFQESALTRRRGIFTGVATLMDHQDIEANAG